MSGKVDFKLIAVEQGTQYIGNRNDISISDYNAHLNSYFNIDIQQAAYFTMLIEGFEYGRFHASYKSITTSRFDGVINSKFDKFPRNDSIYWMPIKSLSQSQGSIETLKLACGAFSDLQLPFRKSSPTLSVECYDHRSDFFEMKLKEWHAQSVLTNGFVPVLDSIIKNVEIRSWATNGECNSVTKCQCILADDITVNRDYESNSLKVVSFKLVVVGY